MKAPTFLPALLLLFMLLSSLEVSQAAVRGKATAAGRHRSLVDLDEDADSGSKKKSDDVELESGTLEGPKKRSCGVEAAEFEVDFECKATDEDNGSGVEIKDEIKFKITAKKGNSLKVKVEYEEEQDDGTVETETETSYNVVFQELLEFRKAASATTISSTGTSGINEGYEWGVDTVVRTVPLDDYTPFMSIDTGNALKYQYSTTTVDGKATFTFTINQDDTGDITANKMKIDFLLEGYDWDPSNDTYVALICSIETDKEIEIETKEDDGTTSRSAQDVVITFDEANEELGFVPFGSYTWKEEADAVPANNSTMDTEPVEVVATSPADETSNAIAFAFATSGSPSIIWDPEAGVAYTASTREGTKPSSAIAVSSRGLFALTAMIAAATALFL